MTAVATATGWSLRRDVRVPAEPPAQPREAQEMEVKAPSPPCTFPFCILSITCWGNNRFLAYLTLIPPHPNDSTQLPDQ